MTTIYYNPETGESYGFGPGQKPPKDWKKLQDIPPHPDWDLIGSGGCVLYDPGKEPRLFVDVETGPADMPTGSGDFCEETMVAVLPFTSRTAP